MRRRIAKQRGRCTSTWKTRNIAVSICAARRARMPERIPSPPRCGLRLSAYPEKLSHGQIFWDHAAPCRSHRRNARRRRRDSTIRTDPAHAIECDAVDLRRHREGEQTTGDQRQLFGNAAPGSGRKRMRDDLGYLQKRDADREQNCQHDAPDGGGAPPQKRKPRKLRSRRRDRRAFRAAARVRAPAATRSRNPPTRCR